jgi:serine/threonine protein kinase
MGIKVTGYDVGQLLGYGSQGEVWSGHRKADGRAVALKRVPVSSMAAARAVKFEAAVLAALDHPSLVQLIEFVICPDSFVLAMELAAGGSLAELLQRRGTLTPAEVAATVSPVAAALAHAHDQGVLHSDVSAANILFTAAGQPKLADLGIARLRWAEQPPGGVVGTPAYLDPVVAAGGASGPPSDVFSLAAVALHALTGHGPWDFPEAADRTGSQHLGADEVLAIAARASLGDLTARLVGLPEAMARVLQRALDPAPNRRGSAAELALDLGASVTAAPVVLTAGRLAGRIPGRPRTSASRSVAPPAVDRRPGRHAARHSGNQGSGNQGSGNQGSGDRRSRAAGASSHEGVPSRPEFARPRFLSDDEVPADLTHIARPRIRAERAEAVATKAKVATLRRMSAAGRRWWKLIATGAVTIAVGIAASAVGEAAPWRADGAAGSAPPPAATQRPDVLGLLQRLDARRSAAFAARRPELLAAVYNSAQLLAQDRGQLQVRVPDGCSLRHLATTYTGLQVVTRVAARIELRVTARLSPTELACPGRATIRTPATGPTALTVVLTRSSSGDFAISSQRVR